MRILIIPARGGSKGIPKKNLRTVNGISLVERALRSALKSKVDQVIVSTDDKDISKIAIKYGAVLHNRSAENSGDNASTESVILEVIDNSQGTEPIESHKNIKSYGRLPFFCSSSRSKIKAATSSIV